ncbi:MAG: 30S ribosomal protein S16 [Proteobacteria bacterium]|nr:30S ribosomal protein S16 [Pseudomonadota bacterium]
MSLRIRLSRGGAKKRPYYRIVVADSRMARDGRFIERLGSFNPMLAKDNPERLVVNAERVQHWLGVGALPSDRMARMLSGLGLVEAPTVPEQSKKSQPKAKAQERLKAQAEAQAAAQAAVAEAAPAAAG